MYRSIAALTLSVAVLVATIRCNTHATEDEAPLSGQRAALAGTWQATGPMPQSRRYHAATVLGSGKVLVTGGWSGGFLNSAVVYEPATGSWAGTGAMAAARQAHVAALLPSGKVLVAGGESSGMVAGAELYEPATGTWSPAGNLSQARGYSTATVLGSGRVLVVGGLSPAGAQKTVDVYDPVAGTWAVGPSLMTPRRSHTATVLASGKVLVVGGWSPGATATAEVYDPLTNTWSATGSLATGRYDHTATLLPSGKVLVAGGRNGGSMLATAEVYDPGTGTWSATGSMAAGRTFHTATRVADKVLVAGGEPASGAAMASAELYDSVTGTWTGTGGMVGARSLHVAAYLSANSQVLVAGGRAGSLLATAELYDASGQSGCTADAHCAAGFYCEAPTCVPKKQSGGGCSSVNECASAYCVDGVCCNSACDGACDACNLVGQAGTCGYLPAATLCRSSTGVCDVAEYCTGANPSCPADGFRAAGASCGTPSYGNWWGCDGFSDTCDELGSQSRTVTAYACTGNGACATSNSFETQACARSTGGMACGTTTITSCGACGGFTDYCDTTGTQPCTVSTPVCSAGSCSSQSSGTSSQSCSRTVDTNCAPPSYGAWSACGGFTDNCDTTGTQSRTVTTYSYNCSNGQCGAATATETQACSRTPNYPYMTCNGQCVNISNRHDHCGGCGMVCPANEACLAGLCDPLCNGLPCLTGGREQTQ